jgi:HrpA-like RNA helicase
MSKNAHTALAALPVFAHRAEIVAAIRGNRITIVTGETGSGKTTGLAHLLLDEQFKQVVITQPRITAATSVAEYVARTRGEKVGQTVGYHSSLYREDSPLTRVMFRTDGLQLARESAGHGIPDDPECVLIIDEHHERSINIDALLALALERLRNGGKFRLVIMSATAEVERLKAFLAPHFGSVPHVHIAGRTFPVRFEQRTASDLVPTTIRQLQKGHNVLVFLPGMKEIEAVCDALFQSGVDAEVLPLYADLSKAEKDLAFASYTRPKVVVATNVAQTSITIPDIDVVVDSGLERVPTLDKNGVPGLMLADTSKADCLQRMGRAGRTKPGTYFLCGAPFEMREAHPAPEIHTNRLDGMVLRLLATGTTPEKLLFMDVPRKRHLHLARQRLQQLGALTKGGNLLTAVGKRMLAYPLDPEYARMMVEAHNRDVVTDMLAALACASVGGIMDVRALSASGGKPRYHDSDLLAQKDIFLDLCRDITLQKLSGPTLEEALENADVVARRFHRAVDVYHKLCELEGKTPFSEQRPLSKLKDMVASIAAGLWPWGVWVASGRHATDAAGKARLISKASFVSADGVVVVGEPFNLETADGEDLALLQNLTVVSLRTLEQVIPEEAYADMLPKAGKRHRSPDKGKKPRTPHTPPKDGARKKPKLAHRARNGRKSKGGARHPQQMH